MESDEPEIDRWERPGENPPLSWEFRVLTIAVVGSIPGAMLGSIIGLLLMTIHTFSNGCYLLMVCGGLLGMLGGGLLEADYWS